MTRTRLTAGMYLVDVPEANLSVLCGCPENAFKILKRAGTIKEVQRDGWRWETGPNAILLSELPVQKGRFCNLIEFPVLQMLYRQGMLVPGHPSNTGKRPLLIGLEEQLEAQARYVHLGNYGLSTLEELVAAGLDEEQAREMLRMKLKFSFGSIKRTDELLEFRVVDSPAVELRGGAFLRRLGLNVYQFLYGDDSVEVDLNLAEGETYGEPYRLPKRQVSREYFSVVHLGEGDGWDRERPCMASLLMYRGEPWLIDAGPNIQSSLEAVGLGVNDLRGVFITHAHDDHFVGLTALLHAERRITFCAAPWVRASVSAKLEALAGLGVEEFGEIFAVRDLVPGRWNEVGGLEVWPFISPHPVETTCFRFRVLGPLGYKTYAHLADLTSFEVLDSMVTADPALPGITRAYADAAKAAYLEGADIKKVDVGGGMIHGSARDFKGDPSGTLYLSHTNMPLSQEDKALGSSAGFGDEEVLIPARIDYSVDIAVAHLRRYFPNLPRSELDILLNCRHDSYNEDTIIIKSGSPFREVHLLLSGVLESLDPEGRVLNSVSSGSLVGEFECLDDSTAPTTLRSRTMVETLSIPGEVYREFAARNALEADTARYREVGAFLRACPLFSDMMSLASFADIAASAVLVRYEDGEKVGGDPGESLHLIVSGSVNLHAGGRRVMDLGRGDVFGEESLVASACCIFEASSVGETIAYVISPAIVRRMPVLLWKLREIFVRRLVAARTSFDFSWRPEYSVGIPLVDEQHRRLFSLLDGLARQASNPATCPDVAPAIVEIKAFALEHFATEEGLMLKREYPDYESHARRHRAIIADLEAWEMDLLCGSEKSAAEFCEFLADWILRHTLSVDRHYIGRIG